MLRRQIKDLSATGHPRETAKLILDGIKGEKIKSKKYIDDYHSVSIHFNKKTKMVNIDVEENGKLIPMKIYRRLAVAQATRQKKSLS